MTELFDAPRWMTCKNWDEYQHYKDRSPPWIKLHRKLLDDRRFASLPIVSKALAPFVWLLASEHDGVFDGRPEEVAFRLRWPAKDVEAGLNGLIAHQFVAETQDASNALAGRKQPAISEAEAEGETETEGEAEAEGSAPPALAPAIISLPTNRFDTTSEEVPINQQQIDDYAATFPGVDVMQQFRQMRRWLLDNRTRRKTAAGMLKFVNTWLSKEQNKPHGPANPKPARPSFGSTINEAVRRRSGQGAPSAGDRIPRHLADSSPAQGTLGQALLAAPDDNTGGV